MSDEWKSGPRKPKATFGDVMLGIRAGDREAPGRGDKKGPGGGDRSRRRDESGPRREAAPKPTPAPTTEAPAAEQPPAVQARTPTVRRGQEKKAPGPLVVVKRASGVVETRAGWTPGAPEAAQQPAQPPPAAEAVPASAVSAPEPERAPPPRAPAPPPPPSALYEEVREDQSFEELYAAQTKEEGKQPRRSIRVGEKVKGTIFQLGADTAFVSLGGKSEAMIELRELKDDEGILRHGVGDQIEAHVIEIGAKGILLSRALSKGSASMAMLAEARASGMPVEGLVLSVNKGGLEVAVGDVRAFCPISQVDLRFVEQPEQFVGEKLHFRVTELRERNVVLSRRALLEEEQRALAGETRKSLFVGAVMKGRVTNVRDFGAFVDLGGVEGLLPVSELSYVRVGHPSEVVRPGDLVEVEVLRMEPANPGSPDKTKHKERITLSMRARMEDPFQKLAAELKEGSRLTGKVVRLQPFGAFVELAPGVDGLVHISALSNRRIAHPRDVVQVGESMEVEVEKIDPAEKRIGLRRVVEGEVQGAGAPAGSGQAPAAGGAHAGRTDETGRVKVGQVVVGKIDRIEPYGVFVAFPGGKGLVPASETGTERGTDMKRHFQLGQELKVAVLEIDPNGKIRLSVRAAEAAEERADMEAWKSKQTGGGGKKGLGTLGDLLKGIKAAK